MNKTFSILLVTTILFSCDSVSTVKESTNADSLKMVGNDKDEHGCITSAGYVWSELRGDCIRTWEVGLPLLPIGDSTVAAYAVFNSDSSKVELFLPTGGKNEILDKRKLPNGEAVWNVEDDDTMTLRKVDEKWQISQRNKVLYLQKR